LNIFRLKWFPNNKATVTGITVGGFGLGALIFDQVQTLYLNPNNISPKDDNPNDDSPKDDQYFILFYRIILRTTLPLKLKIKLTSLQFDTSVWSRFDFQS
jgi:hypothetical protein